MLHRLRSVQRSGPSQRLHVPQCPAESLACVPLPPASRHFDVPFCVIFSYCNAVIMGGDCEGSPTVTSGIRQTWFRADAFRVGSADASRLDSSYH
jgi:hypothetical protein